MRGRQGALSHHLRQVSQAQLVAKVPADAQDDDLALEMPTFEQLVHALHLLGQGTRPQVRKPGSLLDGAVCTRARNRKSMSDLHFMSTAALERDLDGSAGRFAKS